MFIEWLPELLRGITEASKEFNSKIEIVLQQGVLSIKDKKKYNDIKESIRRKQT